MTRLVCVAGSPSPPVSTHGDAVVGHPAPAALADGGRVLQGGAGAVEHVQEDLPAVAAQHVTDDLRPRLPWLLQKY